LADSGTTLIKEPLLDRFDFITLRDGGSPVSCDSLAFE
jgi:hypothetical protein